MVQYPALNQYLQDYKYNKYLHYQLFFIGYISQDFVYLRKTGSEVSFVEISRNVSRYHRINMADQNGRLCRAGPAVSVDIEVSF